MADSSEVNSEQTHENDIEGSGERNERAESGLTRIRDERLTLRAAKWQRGRWNTNATEEDILARIADRGGKATLKETIELKVFEMARLNDSRASSRAMRTAVQMEGQVQRDDLASLNTGQDVTAHGAAPAAPDAIASAMDASVPDVAAG